MAARRKKSRRITQEYRDWHRAVLTTIQDWVVRKYGAKELEHPAVIPIIQKRFVKLKMWVSFYWESYGPGTAPFEMPPFSQEDAAALIVFPKRQALRLARKLFPPQAVEIFEDDGMPFNMDWFYVPERDW